MSIKLRAPRATPLALLLVLATAGEGRAATASVQYGYDPLGRVTTARYDNGTCIVYAYDAAGNRTSQTNTSGGAPESPIWGTGVWGCFLWTAQHVQLPRPETVRQAQVMAPTIRQFGR